MCARSQTHKMHARAYAYLKLVAKETKMATKHFAKSPVDAVSMVVGVDCRCIDDEVK